MNQEHTDHNTQPRDNEPIQEDSIINLNRTTAAVKEKPSKTKKNRIRVASSSFPTPPTLAAVNKSDPCSVLPTEILHRILSYLPPSKIAQTSVFSKAWLDGVRSSPIWKTICDTAGLGKLKLKYKSYMALVCANSYWICDLCFSFSKGRPRASHIPLPVSLPLLHAESGVESETNVWMLCFTCRCSHIIMEDEKFRVAYGGEKIYRVNGIRMVARTTAYKHYSLTARDLNTLEYVVRQHPFSGYLSMQLFGREEVQRLALRTHAGLVGVDAACYGHAHRRMARSKQRVNVSRVASLPRRSKEKARRSLCPNTDAREDDM
ncbi:hypothetical protein BGZ96_007998 [Linnemannia gamsii]|uniref:F-box domain-containing protein n=1 Tax=Linnemannia gamsii TaxID=64522 RepID=A0ABQ7K0J9_9FUNG|nr:hypothetical protein BGZ96_007998 [Linnemannia gamsii]